MSVTVRAINSYGRARSKVLQTQDRATAQPYLTKKPAWGSKGKGGRGITMRPHTFSATGRQKLQKFRKEVDRVSKQRRTMGRALWLIRKGAKPTEFGRKQMEATRDSIRDRVRARKRKRLSESHT